MWPLYVALAIILGLLALVVGFYVLSRWLTRHEPYRSFLRLSLRAKVKFFQRLLTDRRVPVLAKLLPFLLAGYLASPIDLIPDFIPVLGYVDDVAIAVAVLALVLRLTPRSVVDELLQSLSQSELA